MEKCAPARRRRWRLHTANACNPSGSRCRLEILSLARNLISRIEGLEPVAGTLQQLWLSYNNILSLSGLSVAVNLKVLYLANNVIRDYKELDNVPASLEARARARAAAVRHVRARGR